MWNAQNIHSHVVFNRAVMAGRWAAINKIDCCFTVFWWVKSVSHSIICSSVVHGLVRCGGNNRTILDCFSSIFSVFLLSFYFWLRIHYTMRVDRLVYDSKFTELFGKEFFGFVSFDWHDGSGGCWQWWWQMVACNKRLSIIIASSGRWRGIRQMKYLSRKLV